MNNSENSFWQLIYSNTLSHLLKTRTYSKEDASKEAVEMANIAVKDYLNKNNYPSLNKEELRNILEEKKLEALKSL